LRRRREGKIYLCVCGVCVCIESSESVASLGEASRNLILKFGEDSCSCVYISAYMLLMANTKLIKEC
jgi:hypothetical protein